jgi:hypothetical protein
MVMNSKHSFWQGLVVALIIFWTGIILGVYFENSRANKLENFYYNTETDIFDVLLKRDILKEGNFKCENIMKENINFADKVFLESKELEKYDAANKITNDILDLHKRYDLLRVMLWNSVLDLQEKCPGYTNLLVYIYQYDDPNVDIGAKQITFSKVLVDAKEKHGDKVLLIPIAYDTGVKSLELFIEEYELYDFPVVLVNGNETFTELFTVEDLEEYFV